MQGINWRNANGTAIESAWRGFLSLRDPAGAAHAAGPPEAPVAGRQLPVDRLGDPLCRCVSAKALDTPYLRRLPRCLLGLFRLCGSRDSVGAAGAAAAGLPRGGRGGAPGL